MDGLPINSFDDSERRRLARPAEPAKGAIDTKTCRGCGATIEDDYFFCVHHMIILCPRCVRNGDAREVDARDVVKCAHILKTFDKKDCIFEKRRQDGFNKL